VSTLLGVELFVGPQQCSTHTSSLPSSSSSVVAMATRRIISHEKTILEKDDQIGSNPPAVEKSNITPAVPAYISPWTGRFGYNFTHTHTNRCVAAL